MRRTKNGPVSVREAPARPRRAENGHSAVRVAGRFW